MIWLPLRRLPVQCDTTRAGCCAALAAVLTIFGGCGSNGTPASPSSSSIPRLVVVVLGDSLAVSPSKADGFPAHLQSQLSEARLNAVVVNAGVWGDTTADGLKRLDETLVDGTRVLILALGANDGLDGLPLPQIERNLDQIIVRAQARNIRVLLCGMESPPLHGLAYSLGFHQIFPRLAAGRGTGFVPFMLAGVLLNTEMTTDGVHPNAAGARRIAATVWPYLEPIVRGSLATT